MTFTNIFFFHAMWWLYDLTVLLSDAYVQVITIVNFMIVGVNIFPNVYMDKVIVFCKEIVLLG